MMSRPLHWICQGPSPYNDVLFRALAQSPAFDLQVYYMRAEVEESRWGLSRSHGYRARSLHNYPIDYALTRAVLSDPSGILLTSCWQERTSQLLLSVLMAQRRPFLIWNDTPAPRRRNRIKEQLRGVFLRKVFQNAARVLGTGSMALEAFAEMGAPRDKLLNFSYCIDPDRWNPRSTRKPTGSLALGTCARLVASKGIDVAMRALARFKMQSDRPFVYRIAGDGPEQTRLRRLVRDLGLNDHVDFCGWLSQDALPAFYGSLDAYVHPAHFEPYGVAVLEALACGVPVLGSDRTAAALDRVRPGLNGWLHRAGDDVDLLRTIQNIQSIDESQWASMSSAAGFSAGTWNVRRALAVMEQVISELEAPVTAHAAFEKARP